METFLGRDGLRLCERTTILVTNEIYRERWSNDLGRSEKGKLSFLETNEKKQAA